jgi:hypothetical protein
MKIAFIITAYNKPAQLIKLVNCLGNKAGHDNIFVHIDKKAAYSENEIISKTNNLITISKKYSVFWGGFNQLLSILELIEQATHKKEYDCIVLLSGQDLPVVSYDKLMAFFNERKGQSFITINKFPIASWNYKNGLGRVQWFWFMDNVTRVRGVQRFHQISHHIFEKLNIIRPSSRGIDFYGGSDWWILPGAVAKYCLAEFKTNKKLRQCFKYSFIPSEMFFQTVIGNSRYCDTVTNDNKRFISWAVDSMGHPNVITNAQRKAIADSGCLFARKFDLAAYPEIFNYYEAKFLS